MSPGMARLRGDSEPTPSARPTGWARYHRAPGDLPPELDDFDAWRSRWIAENGAEITAETPTRTRIARERAAQWAHEAAVRRWLAESGALDDDERADLERWSNDEAAELLELDAAAKSANHNK
jgi:hypothetical protein